jgi:hypothetical protein
MKKTLDRQELAKEMVPSYHHAMASKGDWKE